MSPNRLLPLCLLAFLAFQVHPPSIHAGQQRTGPRSTGAGQAIERSETPDRPAPEPFPLDRERVILKVTMEATDVGGSTAEIGSAGDAAIVGGQAAVGVGASAGLCAGYTGPLNRSAKHSPWIAHDWEVTATFLDARTDRFTFDLEWVRWDRDASGGKIRGRGDTRTITLQERDRHILDFIEVTDSGDQQHCNTNIVIRIEAEVAEDPELADNEIVYDLWFVERDRESTVETSKATMHAGQGQQASIEFSGLRHDLGRPDAGSPFVLADLGASLLGRVRRDGSIDLSVEALRWFRVGYPTHDPRGGIGATGRLYLNVRPGEIVELEMPSSGASSTNYRDPKSYVKTRNLHEEGLALLDDEDWDGTIVTDDSAMVHYGRFFEDRKFSLVLTARIKGSS